MTTELEGKGSPYALRLGEYVGAAMMDLHRQREALYEIEQLSSDPMARVTARRALRNWQPPIERRRG